MLVETIGSILRSKGTDTPSLPPDATVYDAIVLMAEKGVAAVLVISDETLLGIVTARDYARKVILEGKSSKDVRIKEVMTNSLITVPPETTVLEGMELMTRHHIRHLPVVDKAKLVGIVSMGDMVSAVISEQSFTIDQMKSYIGQ